MSEKYVKDWLDKLHAGDVVIVDTLGGPRIDKVSRTTATQIVVKNTKYRKIDGEAVGRGDWSINAIREPTEDWLKAARHNFLKTYVDSKARTFSNAATIYQLEQVVRLMKDAIEARKEDDE